MTTHNPTQSPTPDKDKGLQQEFTFVHFAPQAVPVAVLPKGYLFIGTNGHVYISTGSAWVHFDPAAVPAAALTAGTGITITSGAIAATYGTTGSTACAGNDGRLLTSSTNKGLLEGAANTTLHFHDADRARSNHTGTQLLATVSDVTITAANLNALDDAADTTLHFHAADRARANHTGSQTKSTISDFAHAGLHVNGTDDIQLATAGQKGLMSAAYASKANRSTALVGGITGTYVVLDTDHTLIVNNAAPVAVTLPDLSQGGVQAVWPAGTQLLIKAGGDTSAQNITLNGPINGGSSFVMSTGAGNFCWIVSGGTSWIVLLNI